MGVSSVVFGMSQTQPTRVAERTERPSGPVYADLAGARVLLTGIDGATGAVLATHFAGQGSRMLVETVDDDLPLAAAVTTSGATVIHLRRTSDAASASARATAQTAAKTFGSIDVAVNFVAMPQGPWLDIAAPDDLEDLIAERLSAAIVATQVTANRMGLTWTPGVILNVLHVPQSDVRDPMIDLLVRDALATLTRLEAEKWAEQAIRVNALVGTGGDDAALARTALRVCSSECAELSGLVFEV